MKHNILYGLFLYAAAIFTIVAMNSFAKLATETYHPFELVFYRNLAGLIVIGLFLFWKKDMVVLKTDRPKAHIVRGLVGTLSAFLVFSAHKYLPVADATALMYAAPLIITAFSGPLLKEKVGLYRWAAVIVGFAGVLIIVSPSGSGSLIGYAYAFAAAFTIAGVSLALRDLGHTENPTTTVFYFLLTGVVVTGIFMPFIGSMPQIGTLWVLAGVCVAGVLQQFLKTKAFVIAPASTLSPLQFTGLVWGVLFGFLFFNDWPTAHVWIGGAVVIASNLFIVWRERKKKKLHV